MDLSKILNGSNSEAGNQPQSKLSSSSSSSSSSRSDNEDYQSDAESENLYSDCSSNTVDTEVSPKEPPSGTCKDTPVYLDASENPDSLNILQSNPGATTITSSNANLLWKGNPGGSTSPQQPPSPNHHSQQPSQFCQPMGPKSDAYPVYQMSSCIGSIPFGSYYSEPADVVKPPSVTQSLQPQPQSLSLLPSPHPTHYHAHPLPPPPVYPYYQRVIVPLGATYQTFDWTHHHQKGIDGSEWSTIKRLPVRQATTPVHQYQPGTHSNSNTNPAPSNHHQVLPTNAKTANDNRQFECGTCSKRFARRSDLMRHERIHTGFRPNVCDICGKQFIQRSALTVHTRVHTGEKPHKCDICLKAFSDSSSLARHRRIHTGKRPYVCSTPGCGKTFTRRTTLTRHLNSQVCLRTNAKSSELLLQLTTM